MLPIDCRSKSESLEKGMKDISGWYLNPKPTTKDGTFSSYAKIVRHALSGYSRIVFNSIPTLALSVPS
jgi:hypothetical protein